LASDDPGIRRSRRPTIPAFDDPGILQHCHPSPGEQLIRRRNGPRGTGNAMRATVFAQFEPCGYRSEPPAAP
jgi:hypothetical protein